VGEEENATYVCEKLVLDLNGVEPVPAYFIRPRSEDPPWPMMLYNHAHGGDYVLGKDELIRGRNAIQSPPYAEALARKGIASLCIDTWNFGERRGRTESELFKEMLWKGQVLWGMMVYDNIRALDYAVSREDVQEARIGTLGLSMGSTMAWWTAALDVRIKVCVDLCCLTDFHALIESRGLDGHGIYYYVPSLLKHFSTADIAALIAPRPHLSVAGIFDKLTPPTGLDRIDKALKQVYSEWDASDAWRMERYHTGHFETADARAKIFAFLDQWL
jgi:cephalosporin-C deacetylase-like acetyl esterase